MQIYNEKLCSKEFIAALDALENGMKVRRRSWPDGQFLIGFADAPNIITLYCDNQLFSLSWISSGEEQIAIDWEILNVRSGGYTDCAACDGNGCDQCMPHIYLDETS